jgi:PST family polysaccharide transporter
MITGSSDAVRQAVEFGVSIVLARLLMPKDFGVVAVIGSILQLSFVLGNFGMGTAVIQAKDLTREDKHTAFTLSSLTGLVLMLCVLAASPWASRFFAMPALSVLTPVMSLKLLLSGMSAVPFGLLRRSLAFKNVAVIEIGSTFAYAVVGISLALSGFGVWSLVWAPMVAAVWTLVAGFAYAGYRPGLALDSASMHKFLGFSSGLTVKNVFVYLSRNIYNLIVAKMLGDHAAGLYTRAFNLTRMPQTRLVALVYRVCFPAFCKLQGETERLHHWYVSATAIVSIMATPVLLGLAALADDFTVAVLGPQWAPMAPVVRILCLSALLNCFHTLGGALIEATGKVGYEVATQSLYASSVVVGCLIGARYGIDEVAYAVLVASAIFYLSKALTVRAAVGLPMRRFVGAVLPSVGAGLAMYVVVYFFMDGDGATWLPIALTGHWERLLAGVGIGAVTYCAALALIGPAHARLLLEQLGEMLGHVRRRSIDSEPETIQA